MDFRKGFESVVVKLVGVGGMKLISVMECSGWWVLVFFGGVGSR